MKDWEDKNNNGERIIYCWDVVNEAADDSGTQLRSASNWYKIYNDDEFIVNAFRFANKYAPKDVLLAYNDYNECQSNKTEMILKIIKSVQSHENDADLPTRIDVMGMQSHNKYGTPSVSTCESTIKKYLATGLDVHITELDIGALTTTDAKDAQKLKKEYKDYFKMYLKYAKKGDEPGVSSVTIWGITDGSTWLNSEGQQQWLNYVKPQYPLLFDDDYYAKPAFYGVLEAAQESN
jgi:endo-1,4-beta-xylanase